MTHCNRDRVGTRLHNSAAFLSLTKRSESLCKLNQMVWDGLVLERIDDNKMVISTCFPGETGVHRTWLCNSYGIVATDHGLGSAKQK